MSLPVKLVSVFVFATLSQSGRLAVVVFLTWWCFEVTFWSFVVPRRFEPCARSSDRNCRVYG